MKFVTTAYGDAYVPLLTVLLESIENTHPNDSVLVSYRDFSNHEVILLKNKFPKYEFAKSELSFNKKDQSRRIASKLVFWEELLCSQKYNEVIVFLDSDMIVYKNISEIIPDDFDVIYTYKNEYIPINTGVIIVRNSDKVKNFISHWRNLTESYLNSDVENAYAVKYFGASDQRAMIDLINPDNFKKHTTVTYPYGDIKLIPIDCEILNQTRSVNLDTSSKILHYKGRWRQLLLETGGYSKSRTYQNSGEMKNMWESMYKSSYENNIQTLITNCYLNLPNNFPCDNTVKFISVIIEKLQIYKIFCITSYNYTFENNFTNINNNSVFVLIEPKFYSYHKLCELIKNSGKQPICVIYDYESPYYSVLDMIKLYINFPNLILGIYINCSKANNIITKYFDRTYFSKMTDGVNCICAVLPSPRDANRYIKNNFILRNRKILYRKVSTLKNLLKRIFTLF